MLNSVHFDNADSIREFAIKDVDFDGDGYDSYDMLLLNQMINAIADNIKSGGNNAFDITKPCAVCGQTGHEFDACPLLRDKGAVTQSYTRVVTALRRLLNSINCSCPTAALNQIASHNFGTVMAITSMDNLSSPSSSSGVSNQLVRSLTTKVVDLTSKYDILVSALSSQVNSATDNADDSDSVSTTVTDESLNALQSFLQRSPDFR